MNNFKEFSAKSIDLAIEEACHYYDLAREKLEIEILEDAKSGIFGIVGVRKAKIRAKKTDISDKTESIKVDKTYTRNDEAKESNKHESNKVESEEAKTVNKKTVKKEFKPAHASDESLAAREEKQVDRAESKSESENTAETKVEAKSERPNKNERSERKPAHEKVERPARKPENERPKKVAPKDDDSDDIDESLPRLSLLELDQEKLMRVAREYTHMIFKHLLPETEIVLSIRDDKIVISITGDEAIEISGRNGQNLFSIQYLLSRMMTKAMESHVRVGFDSGDYKERQEAQLIEIAHNLAEKVKSSGKSMSTRPLSSYHRRIIHVALQNESELTTKSIGDGQLKKVIIFKKRRNA